MLQDHCGRPKLERTVAELARERTVVPESFATTWQVVFFENGGKLGLVSTRIIAADRKRDTFPLYTSTAAVRNRIRPWGFFTTIAWAVPITITALVLRQLVYARVFWTVFQTPQAQMRPQIVGDLVTVCIQTALTLLVVKLRRGQRVRDYLALRRVPWREARPWIFSGVVAALLAVVIRRITNGATSSVNLFTQSDIILLLVTIIVLVPVSEEVFYRGFLLTGLRETRFGDSLAIPFGATMWAFVHANATWHGVAAIFLLGCLLGVMRTACRSIVPGLFVHAVLNCLAIGILVMDGLGLAT
jgi:membrane protease YdiL (CAAX protease family)